MTVAQVAVKYNIAKSTAQRWIKEGKLPKPETPHRIYINGDEYIAKTYALKYYEHLTNSKVISMSRSGVLTARKVGSKLYLKVDAGFQKAIRPKPEGWNISEFGRLKGVSRNV